MMTSHSKYQKTFFCHAMVPHGCTDICLVSTQCNCYLLCCKEKRHTMKSVPCICSHFMSGFDKCWHDEFFFMGLFDRETRQRQRFCWKTPPVYVKEGVTLSCGSHGLSFLSASSRRNNLSGSLNPNTGDRIDIVIVLIVMNN